MQYFQNTTSGKSDSSVEAAVFLPYEKFIQNFKDTLKRVFREENDIDTMSINRGISHDVLDQIMKCNPLSVSIPIEHGGRGGNVAESLQLLSAASYESLALSLTLGINSALFLQPFAKYGQDALKPEVFGRFLKHQNMGGLMITEPDFGSDALNMQTSFAEQSNHYHLKGTKHWAGLTGQADYWLLTARKQTDQGGLQRDIDFFVCDNTQPEQKIVVDERFDNLGLYQIPYGRNIIDVKIPKVQRLIPQTNGVKMMLDLLHRSRLHFPGMGLGFVKRMLDEAIAHCQHRLVGGRSLFSYDQVQQHLARLQANFTILSAFSKHSSGVAGIENDLTALGLEANIIKTVTTDLMQESAQTLLTLVGAKGYKLNHISGRATVDSRPFMIFEGSNDILYAQIGEAVVKLMKSAKENALHLYLESYRLTEYASKYVKDLINIDIDLQMPQRKLVEFGRVISRVASMDMVIKLSDAGFRNDLVDGAISILRQEISTLVGHFTFHQPTLVVEDYELNSDWNKLAIV
ncbi:MAG: acyl-CoA dehydrogenase family protein [Paludibacter sp.]|nr:acyl-CoA dehydrogenase family protein [Paludibacter sp.]